MKKLFFIFLFFNSLIISQTNVSGIIDSSTTWSSEGSPYIISGDLLIRSQSTLTIENGCIIEFTGTYTIDVGSPSASYSYGNIIADGVNFIGEKRETAGGSWIYSGININENSGGILENCVLSQIGLTTKSNSFTINRCDIINSSEISINNLNSSYILIAENNYWGHSSGPYHPTLNPGGQGSEVSHNVAFDPWSTEPINISDIEISIEDYNLFEDHLEAELTENDSKHLLQRIFDAVVNHIGLSGELALTNDVTIGYKFNDNTNIRNVEIILSSPDDPNYSTSLQLYLDGDFYKNRVRIGPSGGQVAAETFFNALGFFAKTPGVSGNILITEGHKAPIIYVSEIVIEKFIGEEQTIEVENYLPGWNRHLAENLSEIALPDNHWGYNQGRIASPVDIQVSNSEGERLGIYDGNLVQEIPYSIYTGDAEPEIFACFSGDALEVDLAGTDNGTFNLQLKKIFYENNEDSVYIEYNGIPVSGSSLARTNFGTGVTTHELKIDNDGDGTFDDTYSPSIIITSVGFSEDKSTIPIAYNLHQNYPNPFNPSTTITYDIPNQTGVSLIIYDILGGKIATLVNNEIKMMGSYDAQFNAVNLPSGVYIYTLKVNEFIQSRKMVLLK